MMMNEVGTVAGGSVLNPLRGEGDLSVAVVVDPTLTSGLMANTVATIAVGLGAMHPGLGRVELADRDRAAIRNSADRPVPILQADNEAMRALLARAANRPDGSTLVAFPAFARSLHAFAEYETAFPQCSLADEQIDGLGLCGPSKWVRSLTGSLKLLR